MLEVGEVLPEAISGQFSMFYVMSEDHTMYRVRGQPNLQAVDNNLRPP